jgi:hypothetical protein
MGFEHRAAFANIALFTTFKSYYELRKLVVSVTSQCGMAQVHQTVQEHIGGPRHAATDDVCRNKTSIKSALHSFKYLMHRGRTYRGSRIAACIQ